MLKAFFEKQNTIIERMDDKTNEFIQKNKYIQFFTDTSTFKKTLLLALFYVFLFYLPFSFYTFVLDGVVFFQLDHLFQFSTLLFDFRNRIYTLNFSTWDWKNAMGYDYFANFYYVPVDFSMLPFLLFPFISYHKLMWLSFLFKILFGTAAFAYLLKLYKLSNKTILISSIIYGTADLFFAQNVFPSFTGLIFYIPMLLIAIEYIVQKSNYFIFTLVIFQMFLFNFYWSWPLSIFMAIALFVRLYHVNFLYRKTIHKFIISIFFYLLGVGLAAFFLLPIIELMRNEPRMGAEFKFNFDLYFKFDKQVYYKTFFKMLVPNLFAYSGYFYDRTDPYYLPTNHIIIYSSILVTSTLLQFILQPALLLKKKLTAKQYDTYKILKWTTLIITIMLFIPAVAFLFSAAQTAYLRWFVFFGVLLIIDFAFLYEYKLLNKYILMITLIISSIYLAWANYYNDLEGIYNASFHLTDETASYVHLVAYGICFVALILFFKSKYSFHLIILIEKIAMITLIFSLLVADGYSVGVRHHSVYGKEMNNLLKEVEDNSSYRYTNYFLNYHDYSDTAPMQNFAYLNNYNGYNNDSVFHSLINPWYKMYKTSHLQRSYQVPNTHYFYNLYMDPTQAIISTDNTSNIINYMYNPESELVASKVIEEFNSTLRIYQKDPELSLGVGFTKFFNTDDSINHYNVMWLDGLYVTDEKIINSLKADGFEAAKRNQTNVKSYSVDRGNIKDEVEIANFPSQIFTELPVNLTREQAKVVIANYYNTNEDIKVLLAKDNNDQLYRCFNLFCYVPEAGLKSILVGGNKDGTLYGKSTIIYYVNQPVVDEKMDALRQYAAYDVNIDGNTVTSKVDNDVPVLMNYKIGYAPGWTVTVDGKKVETFPGHEGLLSFRIMEPGDGHEIVMTYETPKLATGIKITTLSSIVFSGLLLAYVLRKPVKNHYLKAKSYLDEQHHDYIKVGKDLIKHQKTQEFIRFVIIGVMATGISYLFYYLFLKVVDKNIALIIGYIISFGFNFFASNLFTFKTKPTITSGYRFIIAHGINLVNQLILLNIFTFMGLNEKIAVIPVYIIVIPLNYFVVRYALKKKF